MRIWMLKSVLIQRRTSLGKSAVSWLSSMSDRADEEGRGRAGAQGRRVDPGLRGQRPQRREAEVRPEHFRILKLRVSATSFFRTTSVKNAVT